MCSWIQLADTWILSVAAEERFEVSGDEMERHMSLSLDEPEVLRREMPAAEGQAFLGDDTPGSYDADERMEPPPDDMFGNMADMQDIGGGPSGMVRSSCSARHANLLLFLPSVRDFNVDSFAEFWARQPAADARTHL